MNGLQHSDQIGLIEIRLNGEATRTEAATLTELLSQSGIDHDRPGIAVALNERVVRRSDWNGTELSAGDRVEIITAMQGG